MSSDILRTARVKKTVNKRGSVCKIPYMVITVYEILQHSVVKAINDTLYVQISGLSLDHSHHALVFFSILIYGLGTSQSH